MGSESKERRRLRWWRIARMYATGLPEATPASELRRLLRATARGLRVDHSQFSSRGIDSSGSSLVPIMSEEHKRIVKDALS